VTFWTNQKVWFMVFFPDRTEKSPNIRESKSVQQSPSDFSHWQTTKNIRPLIVLKSAISCSFFNVQFKESLSLKNVAKQTKKLRNVQRLPCFTMLQSPTGKGF